MSKFLTTVTWDSETMRVKAYGHDRGAEWTIYHSTPQRRRLYVVNWGGNAGTVPVFLLRDAQAAQRDGYSILFAYNDQLLPPCMWQSHMTEAINWYSPIGSFHDSFLSISHIQHDEGCETT